MYNGISALTSGSKEAKDFRKVAKQLNRRLGDLRKFFLEQKKDCSNSLSSSEEKCEKASWSQWTNWSSCRHSRIYLDEEFEEISPDHIQTRDRKKGGKEFCDTEREERVCNTNHIIKGDGWLHISNFDYKITKTTASGYFKRNGTYNGRPKYTLQINPEVFKRIEKDDPLYDEIVSKSGNTELFYYKNKWLIGNLLVREVEIDGKKFIDTRVAISIKSETTDVECPTEVKVWLFNDKWLKQQNLNENTKPRISVRCFTNDCCT